MALLSGLMNDSLVLRDEVGPPLRVTRDPRPPARLVLATASALREQGRASGTGRAHSLQQHSAAHRGAQHGHWQQVAVHAGGERDPDGEACRPRRAAPRTTRKRDDPDSGSWR